MPDINGAVKYILFMKWFKNNHPRLYDQYKLNIQVPKTSSHIQADMDYVEPQDRELLQDAINEYFKTIAD
jgi:hypothetical protein